MMRVLSRLPERSIFGLDDRQSLDSMQIEEITDFSNVVAKLVTHPLWPSRVPRITNCSPMLGK